MFDPATLALASGVLSLAVQSIPKIREMLASGEVSAEDQRKLRDDINKLRDAVNGDGFKGPEWEKSGR